MILRSIFCRLPNLRVKCNKTSLQLHDVLPEKYNFWKEYKWFHVYSVNCRKVNHLKEETLIKKKSSNSNENLNKKPVKVWKNMKFSELSHILGCDADVIRSKLPSDLQELYAKPQSKMKTSCEILQVIDIMGRQCEFISNPFIDKDTDYFLQSPSKPENLIKRPPVVTIMGHVDHGKTTLLDSLRNTFVVNEEFGGITQHIGAFSVEIKPGQKITFIDTPGHAAFTAMRARGAQITDIVVLVIAADDGIMEQTIESIKIAKRAGVKIIVAVNKIDKAKALNIEDIKAKLLEEGVQVEDKGGDIQLVPISALKKINLDLLMEVILLEAEVMGLKGDPTGLVEGTVIESKIDKRGAMSTVILKRGTLRKGKILLAGKAHARVRSMLDENGKEYTEVLPSTPVQILGWKELPAAGEEVFEVDSVKKASSIIKLIEKDELIKRQELDQKVIEERSLIEREKHYADRKYFKSLTTLSERKNYYRLKYKKSEVEPNSIPSFNLIVKGDVDGTVEALVDILDTYNYDEECVLSIVEASVGNITQNDVELAELFNATIYAFNVGIHPSVQSSVEEKKADIRFHNVIYKLIDDVKLELSSRLPPVPEENFVGEAVINQNFIISQGKKKIKVAGCKCIKGELKKDFLYKIVSEDHVIFQGKLSCMKHHKTEVSIVHKNTDCGLMFQECSAEFKTGDKVICYEIVELPAKTSWNPGF